MNQSNFFAYLNENLDILLNYGLIEVEQISKKKDSKVVKSKLNKDTLKMMLMDIPQFREYFN